MRKYCLIDVSTIIYQTYYRFAKQFGKRTLNPETTTAFLLDQLNALIEPGVQLGYMPVYLYDRKQDGAYWRQNFIDDHSVFYSELWTAHNPKELDTAYKGGRLKPEAYNVLLKYTRDAAELLKKQGPWFDTPGLEADDFVGLFVKYKPEEVYLDLLTVDRDWSCCARPKVQWINMLPKKRYQIETEVEVVEYFKAKLDPVITTPIQAFEAKRVKGELGDQLPPGCHIELIDIVNYAAPIDYGFAQDHQNVINFYKA
jgi:5'-3' exonuclease, N-terminal resolvase-like domain